MLHAVFGRKRDGTREIIEYPKYFFSLKNASVLQEIFFMSYIDLLDQNLIKKLIHL